MNLIDAVSEHHYHQARKLFEEYANSLGFDLDFQDFKHELEHLPGDYAIPDGCLVLAMRGDQAVGCVALRKITAEICEMKRLYVRPDFQGQGIGRRLAVAIIGKGKTRGYRDMRLDTVPSMGAAISLYGSLGFKVIEPYRYNPIEGAIFMELALSPP